MTTASITNTFEDAKESDTAKLVIIDLPDVPSFHTIQSDDPRYSWLFVKIPSMPLPAITRELYPHDKQILNSLKETKTLVLGKLFSLLASPIEKFNLIQLLLPNLSRDRLITKQQIVRVLLKYTDTENINSGTLRSHIDSLDVGKSTETVTEKFINDVITILELYWTETTTLKNANFKRIENVKNRFKNQITLNDISVMLDEVRKQKTISVRTDFIFPSVQQVLDMLYVMRYSPKSISLILQSMFGSNLVIERVVLNALCDKPRGLASAIFKSHSDLWKVVVGIEYLKSNLYPEWRKMTDLTKDKRKNVKFIVNVKPGIPCAAMRCTRIYEHDYEAIVDKVSKFVGGMRQELEGYCIEEKIDGERSFLHFWRDSNHSLRTVFYSRNRIAQSWYGSFVGDPNGIITKYLNKSDFDGIDSMILDGEMVTYDEIKHTILGFQDVKRCSELLHDSLKQGKDLTKETLYNKLLCFDVLFFNGKSLQSVPLKERKSYLSEIFQKLKCKFVQMHKFNIGYNANDVKIAMIDVQNKNAEGLVLKQWDSRYFVGSSNEWIKFKPSYIRDFIDDLDVTIIGKEGHNFICALYGNDPGEKFEGWFVSFCNVRFGLDKMILSEINDATAGRWIPYTKGDEIEWIENRMKFGTLKPKFWIKPSDSIVINIKARSLNYNHEAEMNRFILNTTLRHPYCLSVRTDKRYNECDSILEYEKKIALSAKKRQVSMTNNDSTTRKKRETVAEKAVKEANQNFVLSMEKKDDLFAGITFCILTDCEVDGKILWKAEINGLLKSHGAQVVEQPSHCKGGFLMVIADKQTTLVNFFKKEYNIFRFKWCYDCINSNSLVLIDPSHCLIVDEDVQTFAYNNIDEFGCNFTVKYNAKELWEMSEQYSKHGHSSATIIDTETADAIGLCFHGVKFAFKPNTEITAYEKELQKLTLELYGGEVVDDLTLANVLLSGFETVEDIKKILRT
ncbi:hypothetical protein CANINC_000864 [Pichia inconspicua]|uniref:DNA ligase (ATP) n=1 Tax=Pichia inconspicua TaxID=52247 RepID=A0A4T0X4X9_9ASCO|nr:hypothetical protein CANINC_000864 [[Candida] inconspicua]